MIKNISDAFADRKIKVATEYDYIACALRSHDSAFRPFVPTSIEAPAMLKPIYMIWAVATRRAVHSLWVMSLSQIGPQRQSEHRRGYLDPNQTQIKKSRNLA